MQKQKSFYIIPHREISGGGNCFGVVRPFVRSLSVLPSVTLFCPDAYLGNGFLDFIVVLHEYVLPYEDGSHQVWLHCTNWKQSYGPLLLSNIHSRQINFLSRRIFLGNGFSDFIIPCRRFRGGYCFALSVRPSSFHPSSRYRLRKVDQRRIVKSLAVYH